MERKMFEQNFIKAIDDLIKNGEDYFKEKLSDSWIIYAEDNKSNNGKQVIHSVEEGLDVLFKNGKVPRWINLKIKDVKDDIVIIECIYSADYIKEYDKLLYKNGSIAPFALFYPAVSKLHTHLKRSEKLKKLLDKNKK